MTAWQPAAADLVKWMPANAVSIRSGDVVRLRAVWPPWREITATLVDHAIPSRPVRIVTTTGATIRLQPAARVTIAVARRYSHGP